MFNIFFKEDNLENDKHNDADLSNIIQKFDS